MTDRFIKIFRILCGFMILIMLISAGFSQSAFAEDLIINGPQSADPNSLISFTVIVNNAPNHVEAFRLDILFDPNVLNVVADPNGVVTLEKGSLIDHFTVLGYKISADRVRVGGIVVLPEETNKIFNGSIGKLFSLSFIARRTYTENDIQITTNIDDISGWTTETILGAWLFLSPDSESGLCFMNSLI